MDWVDFLGEGPNPDESGRTRGSIEKWIMNKVEDLHVRNIRGIITVIK